VHPTLDFARFVLILAKRALELFHCEWLAGEHARFEVEHSCAIRPDVDAESKKHSEGTEICRVGRENVGAILIARHTELASRVILGDEFAKGRVGEMAAGLSRELRL